MDSNWDISADLVDMLVGAASGAMLGGTPRERVHELIGQRIALTLNPILTPDALAYCVVRIAEEMS